MAKYFLIFYHLLARHQKSEIVGLLEIIAKKPKKPTNPDYSLIMMFSGE